MVRCFWVDLRGHMKEDSLIAFATGIVIHTPKYSLHSSMMGDRSNSTQEFGAEEEDRKLLFINFCTCDGQRNYTRRSKSPDSTCDPT